MTAAARARSAGPGTRWWRWWAAAIALLAVWSLATPLLAAPDEPSQFTRAVSLVRGQLDPPLIQTIVGRQFKIQIPAADLPSPHDPACFAFHPDVPASCSRAFGTAHRLAGGATAQAANPAATAATTTQFGNYPPLYYAVVGLPTLMLHGAAALWSARLVALLCCAALLGLAGYLLRRYHPRPALLLGLAIALTPEVLFFGGVVSDSGVEIAAGVAFWAGLVTLIDLPGPLARRPLWLTTVAGVALTLSRPLSPAWVLIGLVITGFAATPARRRELLLGSATAPMRAVLAAALTVSLAWTALHGVPYLLHAGPPATVSVGAALSGHWVAHRLASLIGLLGWEDTPAPTLTLAGWAAAVILLLGTALATLGADRARTRWRHRRRRRAVAPRGADRGAPDGGGLDGGGLGRGGFGRGGLATLILMLGVLAIPATFTVMTGEAGQGRDVLPIAVGVPLLLARLARPSRRSAFLLVLLLSAGQVAMFAQGLRRYGVGLNGPLPGLGGRYQPPLGAATLLAAEVLLTVAAAAALLRAQRYGAATGAPGLVPRRPGAGSRQGAPPAPSPGEPGMTPVPEVP